MATRLYLPSSGAPAVSPSYDSSWERTDDTIRRECVNVKTSTPMTTVGFNSPAGDEKDACAIQYVSKQLASGVTITGTVKGQLRASTDNTSLSGRAQMVIRVVSADGLTVRGTLLGPDTASVPANTFVVALTNRKFPKGSSGATLTSVAASAGDRIVIELGAHNHQNPAIVGHANYAIRVGDTGGTDLAEDETTTTDNVPWVEFSQTLTLITATGDVSFTGGGDLSVGAGVAGPDYDFQVVITF